MTGTGHNDFENYRKMQEPHENTEAAELSVNAFFQVAEAARNHFRIMDADIIVQVAYKDKEGQERTAMCTAHFGDSLKSLSMLTWALEEAKKDIFVSTNAEKSKRKASR